MKIKVLLSMALSLALICSGTSAWAKVQGPCADCHTMHNSQDGAAVDADGPSRSLTIGGCIGCHTGTNDGGNTPYVNQSGEPTYVSGAGATNPTLAGGSFYWVDTEGGATDSKGHNVVGIAGTDSMGQTPPGFNGTTAGDVGIGTDWTANQLTCAGTYGCHGPHTAADDFTDISGAHHGDSGIAADFRFLTGITGVEDPDWEYSVDTTDRNVYHGEARTDASDNTSDTATISYFCSTCHGDYHAGSEVVYGGSTISDNPWLRHPSDYDMAATDSGTEYRSYTTYSVEAPVAADTSTITTATDQNTALGTMGDATPTSGAAIVTCISCHRAHGSPYADLLRWDYAGMEAGGTAETATGEGCFKCHTTKDDA